jgi:recombination protein RecT
MKKPLEQTNIFDLTQPQEMKEVEVVLNTVVTNPTYSTTEQEENQVPEQPIVIAPPTPAPTKTLSPIQKFQSYLESYKESVLPNLLKKHNIEPAQFVQIVISELKKNEKLVQAFQENPSSMFASILAGAEIGLIPSDMLGEFYLIPRRIDGKQSVTPLIGYKGLVNILLRSGEITKIHTECVFQGDEFEPIYGLEPNIIHKPNFDVERSANTLKFVYAVAKLKNGDHQFQVLSKGDIIKIKALSRYDNDLYFNDKKDPNLWMVRKTALIQLAKMLPKDFYGKKAVEMDNQLEGGAMLTLDENNEIKIVDGKKIVSHKQASVVNTLNSLPEIPQ